MGFLNETSNLLWQTILLCCLGEINMLNFNWMVSCEAGISAVGVSKSFLEHIL